MERKKNEKENENMPKKQMVCRMAVTSCCLCYLSTKYGVLI
jgi:hypothetical protein